MIAEVRTEVKTTRLINITLDEETARNLMTLLWETEDFGYGVHNTLYSRIAGSTNIRRKDGAAISRQVGQFTFYKVIA